jgi:hypothetical protein
MLKIMYNRYKRKGTLRDVFTDRAKNQFRRNGNKTLTSEDFWALKQENYGVASSGRMR